MHDLSPCSLTTVCVFSCDYIVIKLDVITSIIRREKHMTTNEGVVTIILDKCLFNERLDNSGTLLTGIMVVLTLSYIITLIILELLKNNQDASQ